MEDNAREETELNLSCNVCGERQFKLRDGYYYCQECGTKQDQVRDVEVERDDEFNDSKHVKKKIIKKLTAEKPQLTSWECYNYILRGLVEEMLSFGAKDDLKLMTLQVWAAYLRSMEVAFFSKKHAELPKLGVRFLKRDARTLYNHCQEKRNARKRRRRDDTSFTSGDTSGREWRKSKRKLDESVYSIQSASFDNSLSQTSGNTASSVGSTRAIQLKFSTKARKHFKKVMPVKHLEKHEKDGEGQLQCHKLKPHVRSLNRMEYAVQNMNIKQVYSIVAIALNLIEDEVQMSDLVRFIAEGHISTRNVVQYFPENIAPHCKQLLQEIDFYLYPDKYSDKVLREHVGLLAKKMKINEFKQPNIFKLVLRYVDDLNLPADVTTFVERLMNLLPPQMQTRAAHVYPPYEARAMAYILFVLKLLCGLDGHKEKLISASAKRVNAILKKLDIASSVHPSIFVWSEWMEYIEMRKVIVAQYDSNFCRQFKQCQSSVQLLEELYEAQRQQNEQDLLTAEGATATNKPKVTNMQRIFENFQNTHKSTTNNCVKTIAFQPSFTPAHSYFKRILLHSSSDEDARLQIPDFMKVDHREYTLQPHLQPHALREQLEAHDWHLKVRSAACTSNRCYVGMFRAPLDPNDASTKRADFNVSEQEWLANVDDGPVTEELEFKRKLDEYAKAYVKKLEAAAFKRTQLEEDYDPQWFTQCQSALAHRLKSESSTEKLTASCFLLPSSMVREKIATKNPDPDNTDVLSLRSFDVFDENDMMPVENLNLNAPRRNLDTVNLFDGLTDDEEDDGENDSPIKMEDLQHDEEKTITLISSKMDCWILLGYMNILSDVQKKTLEKQFPRSFFWLLETCAQTIGVEWCVVYEQLLAIEMMFVYGIEKLDNIQDCIRFRYNNPIKDINMLVNSYREIW